MVETTQPSLEHLSSVFARILLIHDFDPATKASFVNCMSFHLLVFIIICVVWFKVTLQRFNLLFLILENRDNTTTCMAALIK